MGKKFVIGVLALLSVIAFLQTTAAAATCLSWKTIGGSSMCVAWATKGVQVAITFRDGCFVSGGEGGTVQDCQVTVNASGTDSFAFCGSPTNPVKVACDQPFAFGPTSLGVGTPNSTCVERPDNESATGEAHEQHKCVATATLNPAGAQAACNTCCATKGLTCLDLTPVEMHTDLEATYFGGGNEVAPCTPGSLGCNVEQTCSINPKKIAFITDPSQGKEYQCNFDCVGDACPLLPPPPPPCSDC